jgi:hypothetical protein
MTTCLLYSQLRHAYCKVDYVAVLARTAPERPSVDLPLRPFHSLYLNCPSFFFAPLDTLLMLRSD